MHIYVRSGGGHGSGDFGAKSEPEMPGIDKLVTTVDVHLWANNDQRLQWPQ